MSCPLPALRENVESLTLAASFKAECYSSSNKTRSTKIGSRNHFSLAVTATWNMLVIFPALFSSCGDICCDFQILGKSFQCLKTLNEFKSQETQISASHVVFYQTFLQLQKQRTKVQLSPRKGVESWAWEFEAIYFAYILQISLIINYVNGA